MINWLKTLDNRQAKITADFTFALQLEFLTKHLASWITFDFVFGSDSHFAVSCWEPFLCILAKKCFDSSHDKTFSWQFLNDLRHGITTLTFGWHKKARVNDRRRGGHLWK